MALVKVSQRVIYAVQSRLSASDGFNAGITAQAPNYGLSPFIQVNWTANSTNFVLGQIEPDLLDNTGIISYPFVTLYILESGQTGEQRFSQFSGLVRCIFDVYLSWIPIKGKQNHDAYANCVEDVVYDVINRTPNQDWGKPLVYNGTIQCRRAPIIYGAENFKQKVGFAMLFGIHE